MGRIWERRNGEMPPYWAMAYIPQTYPNTATAATPDSRSATPSIARGVASSRRVTTRSVTGLRIWLARILPPHTCATTPSSTRFAPWRRRKTIQPVPLASPTQRKIHQRPRNRRETFCSRTSGRMGLTVFTTCVSWKLIQSPIRRIPPRSVWRRRRRVRIRCTCRLASISVDTAHPSSPPLMDYSGWRRRLPWKG